MVPSHSYVHAPIQTFTHSVLPHCLPILEVDPVRASTVAYTNVVKGGHGPRCPATELPEGRQAPQQIQRQDQDEFMKDNIRVSAYEETQQAEAGRAT